jgi:glycosidase
VFTNKLPVRALRAQLKYDSLYPDPSELTTLTNYHDTRRFMSLDGATLEGAMFYTALMLTVRGTPQIRPGEEITMQGGDDPTIVANYIRNERLIIPAKTAIALKVL